MKTYPGQPEGEKEITEEIIKCIEETVATMLGDELPDCSTNEWFIESVYFANMIDKIVAEVIDCI